MTAEEAVDAAQKLDIPAIDVPVEELRARVKATLEDLLREETREAIASHVAWIARDGVLLAKRRRF